jgi:hypothetical protein
VSVCILANIAMLLPIFSELLCIDIFLWLSLAATFYRVCNIDICHFCVTDSDMHTQEFPLPSFCHFLQCKTIKIYKAFSCPHNSINVHNNESENFFCMLLNWDPFVQFFFSFFVLLFSNHVKCWLLWIHLKKCHVLKLWALCVRSDGEQYFSIFYIKLFILFYSSLCGKQIE